MVVVVGDGLSCGVGWKRGVLLLGGTVVFAVERWARKGRNTGGKREGWE